MDEVNKLLAVDFICEVYYSDWLANIVLVKKTNGKWRMCVDFIDLNKAYSKDNFPLPRIDGLVDSMVRQDPYIHGCVLGIQPDQDVRKRPGKYCLCHKLEALLLKCKSNLLEVSQQNVQ